MVQQFLAIGLDIGKSKLKLPEQQHPQKMTTFLQSVIAPKRIDRFWCAWCQLLAFFKLYKIHQALYHSCQNMKKSIRKKPSDGVHAIPQWVLGKKKYPSISAIFFSKYTPFRVEKYENLNNMMGKFFFLSIFNMEAFFCGLLLFPIWHNCL